MAASVAAPTHREPRKQERPPFGGRS